MEIIPKRLDNLDLSQGEKLLIKKLEQLHAEDGSILLAKANPVGSSNIHALISSKGVVFIEHNSINNTSIIPHVVKGIESNSTDLARKIHTRLSQHKMLKVKNGDKEYLKFPFTYKVYFSELKEKEVTKLDVAVDEKEFLREHCIYQDTQISEEKPLFKIFKDTSTRRDLQYTLHSNVKNSYWGDWDGFSKEEINYVIQMICPEYTIPIPNTHDTETPHVENIAVNESEEVYDISKDDFNVKVHRLDEEQIQIINNLRRGNQLILACAGSGKSVILISKAFRAASIHTDQNFLITCFNRNLASFYQWKMGYSGYRERNVKAVTFHKLIQELLHEAGIQYSRIDHEENFEKANKALHEGKIKRRYYGIFLDEIQVFKPEWYEFCYYLLANHERDNYFFTICGDISQNVNRNIKKGGAPWQSTGNLELPKYTGRSLRIDKNYRNSIEINDFVTEITKVSKKYLQEFNINVENEEETFLMGKAFRTSTMPRVIKSDRMNVVEKVIEEIIYLRDKKKVPLERIAIIFPFRQYQPNRYYFYNWLVDKLREKYIESYSLIVGQDGTLPAIYGMNSGVALTTIESSLGLDFDAVILSGLFPMGSYYNSKSKTRMTNSGGTNEELNQEFIDCINKIYTACTRARDHLTIVLEEDENISLYSKIILESYERVMNNE